MFFSRFRPGTALIALLTGCGPWTNLPEETTAADASSSSSGGQTVPNASGTTGVRLDLGGGGSTSICVYDTGDDGIHPRCETGGTGTTIDDTGVSFILPTGGDCHDTLGSAGAGSCGECSVFDQDCPEGEKCQPWANDGGNSWNASRCSPVDPAAHAPGDPCTVEGSGVSGVDSCDFDSMCWNVDPETNEGTCVPRCSGTESQPLCPDQSQTCMVANQGALWLCLPACDPRDPTTCEEGHGCYEVWDTFVCLPFGAQVYESFSDDGIGCDLPASCEPGTMCYADDMGPQCDDPPCCSDWCDTQDPEACPNGGTCSVFYEPSAAPAGFETLGWCEPIPGG